MHVFRGSDCFIPDSALAVSQTDTFLPSFRNLTHVSVHRWLTKKCCFRKGFNQSQFDETDENTAGGEGRRDTSPLKTCSHICLFLAIENLL